MAALSAKEKNLDDLFLSDVKGNILETSSSNVFVVSNGVLYTPGLDEGCLAGTMRMQVINLALNSGIKVYECSILPQNLLAADEVFITNAIISVLITCHNHLPQPPPTRSPLSTGHGWQPWSCVAL